MTVPSMSIEDRTDGEMLLDDLYGEVTHNFTPAVAPRGVGPLYAASTLVGVELPIREKVQTLPSGAPNIEGFHDPESTLLVAVEDIVVTLLDRDNQAAANYWGGNYGPQHLLVLSKAIGTLEAVENEPALISWCNPETNN